MCSACCSQRQVPTFSCTIVRVINTAAETLLVTSAVLACAAATCALSIAYFSLPVAPSFAHSEFKDARWNTPRNCRVSALRMTWSPFWTCSCSRYTKYLCKVLLLLLLPSASQSPRKLQRSKRPPWSPSRPSPSQTPLHPASCSVWLSHTQVHVHPCPMCFCEPLSHAYSHRLPCNRQHLQLPPTYRHHADTPNFRSSALPSGAVRGAGVRGCSVRGHGRLGCRGSAADERCCMGLGSAGVKHAARNAHGIRFVVAMHARDDVPVQLAPTGVFIVFCDVVEGGAGCISAGRHHTGELPLNINYASDCIIRGQLSSSHISFASHAPHVQGTAFLRLPRVL